VSFANCESVNFEIDARKGPLQIDIFEAVHTSFLSVSLSGQLL
jgi:hypothetical protein